MPCWNLSRKAFFHFLWSQEGGHGHYVSQRAVTNAMHAHTDSSSGQRKMTVRQRAKHNRWTDWERWSDCQNHWKQMAPLIRRHRRNDGLFWQDGRARSTPADSKGWKQKDLIWKGRCGGADVGRRHDVEYDRMRPCINVGFALVFVGIRTQSVVLSVGLNCFCLTSSHDPTRYQNCLF